MLHPVCAHFVVAVPYLFVNATEELLLEALLLKEELGVAAGAAVAVAVLEIAVAVGVLVEDAPLVEPVPPQADKSAASSASMTKILNTFFSIEYVLLIHISCDIEFPRQDYISFEK